MHRKIIHILLLAMLIIPVAADYPDSLTNLARTATKHRKAELFNLLGIYYSDKGQLDKAIYYFNDAISIFQKEKDNNDLINTYLNLSEVYLRKGEYEKTLECTQKSLEAAVRNNDPRLERQYNQFGYIYSEWGQYDKSVEYYKKSLEIARKEGNKTTEAAALNNIGYVHKLWKNYDLALDFFKQTYSIDSSLCDSSLIACDLNNIAYILRCQQKHAEAVTYYNKAVLLCSKKDFIYEKALAYNGLGNVYNDLKHYRKAFDYLQQSVPLFIISGNENYLPSAYHNIGVAFQGLKEPDSALLFFFKSLQLARKMNIQEEVVDVLNSISATYYSLKEYDKAYEYKQLYNAANDSVFNLKKHQQLAEFQGKFDLDKKTSEINKLATMQQRSNTVIRLQWLLVMVSFLFIVGLGFLVFWLYKKYKQHKRLAEFLSQQKENIELKLKALEKKVPGPYAGSNLSENELSNIIDHLQLFLVETRLYLNNDLTLPFLSEKAGISVHHLSQAVNLKTGQNFNDYINSFRIKEAKLRLLSPEFNRFTLEAVGRSVGFNNKTTFIAAFRKNENKTPSEYIKQAISPVIV